MSKFAPQLWGDGELFMYSAPRAAFSGNTEAAMLEVKTAWGQSEASGSAGQRYWESMQLMEDEQADKTIEGLLAHAGELQSFLQLGTLQNGEITADGTIDADYIATMTECDSLSEDVKADLKIVEEQLHGNVFSAWFDEDANNMSIESIMSNDQNDGNTRLFFVLTKEKAYVFDFMTS